MQSAEKPLSEQSAVRADCPYRTCWALLSPVVEQFDGLLCAGGRFAYLDEWRLGGSSTKAPPSERSGTSNGYIFPRRDAVVVQ